MPYGSIFPVAQLFTSPLAVDLTVAGGSTYKCIYGKTNITDEFNAENYEITALVKTATATVIADNSEVTIAGVTYEVTHRIEEEPGLARLFLSKADHEPAEPSVGPELFPSLTSVQWTFTGGANNTGGIITLKPEAAYVPTSALFNNYITLTEGATYRFRLTVDQLTDGAINLADYSTLVRSFSFFIESEGTIDLYFEARSYYCGYIVLYGINNTTDIKISAISLKKVL